MRRGESCWRNPLVWAFGVMLLYSAGLVALTGATGYWGDGMLLVDKAFWEPIPEAYTYGARAMIRPFYTFYTITLMKLFNYNSVVVLAAAMLIFSGACGLFGVALIRAFSGRMAFATMAAIITFTMPLAGVLAFDVSRVNSRLVMLFFWGAVVAFQHWAEAPRRWTLPGIPILLLVLAHLSYESALTLIPVVVLLVVPVYWRHNAARGWGDHLLIGGQLVVSLFGSTALYFYIRSLYRIETGFQDSALATLGGENVGAALASFGGHVVSSFTLLFNPLRYLPFAPMPTLLGVGMAGMVAGVWWAMTYTQPAQTHRTISTLSVPTTTTPPIRKSILQHPAYIVLVGMSLIVLSLATFALSGYQPAYTGLGDRNYSAAVFGVALVLALPTLWVTGRPRSVYAGGVVLLCGLWGGIIGQVGWEHRMAYDARQAIYHSHYNIAPALQPDTAILLLNADQIYGNFGPINSHVGMTDYFRMFYQNRLMRTMSISTAPNRPATLTPNTLTSVDTGDVDIEQVIVMAIVDNTMTIVDCVTPDDGYNLIWEDGVQQLCSNTERIIAKPERVNRFWRIFGIVEG